uniref:Myelin basic protein n=1 Tax=Sus scrofa TaxID=9823 RepID=A0A4X1U578_PIG
MQGACGVALQGLRCLPLLLSHLLLTGSVGASAGRTCIRGSGMLPPRLGLADGQAPSGALELAGQPRTQWDCGDGTPWSPTHLSASQESSLLYQVCPGSKRVQIQAEGGGRWPGLRTPCPFFQDGHHAARTTHYGSLPQKAQHGRPQDENPVVHFFKNIVTPRTPPPSQGKGRGLSLSRFSWGAEGQKPGFGYGGRAPDYKPAHKGLKGAQDAQGTLSKIFKLVMYLPDGGGSRAASSLSTSCFLAGPPPSCSEQAFLQALPEQSLCQVTGPGPLRELEDKGATAGPWQGQDQEASLSREPAGAKVT